MRPNAELRLFAVPLCNGLVCCLTMASPNSPQESVLFQSFLFGVISAALLGIPLLLLGDRYCARFKARHFVSAFIQVLITYLMLGRYSLLLAMLQALTLGAMYSFAMLLVDKLPVKGAALQRKGVGTVVAVPLSGGITLAGAAMVFLPMDNPVSLFLVYFVVGALLSMVFSWPVLWLVERFITTCWRYVIGGVISSLLIWLMCVAPLLLGFNKLAEHPVGFPPLFREGAAAFLLIGLIAGLLCTAFNWLLSAIDALLNAPAHNVGND